MSMATVMKLIAFNPIRIIGRPIKLARTAKVGGGTKTVIDHTLLIAICFIVYVYAS